MSKSPLTTVYKQMQRWLALVGFTYAGLFSFQKATRTLYDANSFVFGSTAWLRLSGILVLFAIMFLATVQPSRDLFRKMKRSVIIVCLIYLLALAVLLTGGFIDSPFSGAISLYIGFFIALIQAGKYRGMSCLFMLLTVACIVAPYVILGWQNHNSFEILKWHTSGPTTAVRLAITIALLLFTAWFGGKVSNELKQFSESEKRPKYVL